MNDRQTERITASARTLGVYETLVSAAAVVVAYSGGADSSLLLEYLHELRKKGAVSPIIAVHVNHMLRGSEADADEEFCRAHCAAKNIPFYSARVDVPALMRERGLGAEECAREARYAVLDGVRGQIADDGDADGAIAAVRELARGRGDVLIATAHNADDNLETVIFNLARGSGASGLSGITPLRDDGVIRPLLGLSSAEIREMCKSCGIEYVYDRTNGDTAYTRNFIRREIVPRLREINPAAHTAALRAGIVLRDDEAYFRKKAAELLGKNADGCSAPRELLSAAETPVLERALVMLMANISPVAMGEGMISDACRMIKREGTGRLSLPDGVVLEVSKNTVSFERPVRTPEPFSFEVALPRDGECLRYSCPEAGFDLFLYKNDTVPEAELQNIYKLFIHTETDFDTIYGRVYVRSRCPGERILLGDTHRRIKKMLCDRGVPVSMRARIPAVCDDKGIFIVPYLPPRTTAKGATSRLHVLFCPYSEF